MRPVRAAQVSVELAPVHLELVSVGTLQGGASPNRSDGRFHDRTAIAIDLDVCTIDQVIHAMHDNWRDGSHAEP